MTTKCLSHTGVALASLALRRGFVTAGEVRDAFAEQSRAAEAGKGGRDIGMILVAQGSLSEEALMTLLADEQLLEAPERQTCSPLATSPLEKWGRRVGKYVLIRELGRGAAGTTYEAQDTVLERRVALKLIDPRCPAAGETLLTSLPPHPHLVPVYEVGREGDQRYVASELVRGRTFDAWRAMGAPLWKSVSMVRDIARAVHQAHEHGVVHGNLASVNILVDSSDAPRIMDFGLTAEVDRRADVRSLGVLLHEVLTGLPPSRRPAPVEGAAEGTIEAICRRALARNPDHRYPTALEFAAALDRWLTGESGVPDFPAPDRGFLESLLAAAASWLRPSRSVPGAGSPRYAP